MNLTQIGIGILLMIASFASITSASTSKLDQDLSLILMIVGVVCILLGANLLDISSIISKEVLDNFKTDK